MKKTIIIVLGLILVGFVGTCVYRVLSISSVYPPIKKYVYSGSANQLITGIREYVSTNSNVSFKITDTVGDNNTGYATRVDIELKHQMHYITYNLQFEEKKDGMIVKTSIELLGAYDKTGNIGGYIKEAKGVKPLVDVFESDFLIPLKNKQNINITPL
jgi:hypothetical protein